jgi:NADPH-dependent 2,4-dienoyl-CoA reductase/sulfur reductase-like enzyme
MPGSKFVILGSGDIGMIMARRLTLEGAKVERVIEIMPFLTGLRRNYVQCLQDFNIRLDLQHTVKRVMGNNRVTGVEIAEVDNSFNVIEGSEEIIPCDTLILSVGLIPENELSRKVMVNLDPVTEGPIVDNRMETNIRGIFAAGNVVNIHDLVDYVTLSGYIAGKNASLFVQDKLNYNFDRIAVEKGNNLHNVVPHFINIDASSEDEIMFQMRVNKIFEKPVKVEFKNEEKEIVYTHNEKYARPAEMIIVNLKIKDLISKLSSNCKKIKVNIVEK